MSSLTKSLFLTGMECPLKMWKEVYESRLIPELTPAEQHRLDEGIAVGKMACKLYPDGVRVETDNCSFEESVARTAALMEDETIPAIFEASFEYDNLRIRVDVLRRAENGQWDIVEVKSTTGAKEEHFYDVGFQYMILKSLGIVVDKIGLMHLNREYIYDGLTYEIEKMFELADMTLPVKELEPILAKNVELSKKAIASEQPPEPNITTQCRACIFFEYCPHHIAEYPILWLPRIASKKYDKLREMGVTDIRQIPDDFPLSEKQATVRSCTINESDDIKSELKNELEAFVYPLYFLDFESFSTAMPVFAGTRPYQQIVFQWSCHKQSLEGGPLEHYEFLHDGKNDPRKSFVKSLIESLGVSGTIIHYAPFERARLNELADSFPEFGEDLRSLVNRLWDLYQSIYRNYYNFKFQGSFSIKKVLPVLVPDLSYDDLNIRQGDMASLGYLHLINPETSLEQTEGIRESLLKYCERDTLAMVVIYRALREKTARL